MLRLNVVFYGAHTPDTDARIIRARPQYVIDNPPHGLYGQMWGYTSPSLLQRVAQYREAGIKVMGYITGGYEGSGSGGRLEPTWYSLDTNKRLVMGMAEADRVDGVFLDECSAFPDRSSKRYLKDLTTLAHSYRLMVWGNPGTDDFDSWFLKDGGFDFVHSTEQWTGQNLGRVQRKWAHRVSVTGFSPWFTAEDAGALTLDAWKKGLAYCYITHSYTALPAWFEDYVQFLQEHDSQ